MNENLMKTKYELVVDEIEKIGHGLVWEIDTFYGDSRKYTLQTALKAYGQIKSTIESIPDLSDEEKTKLIELVDQKIKEAPEREQKENQIANEVNNQYYEGVQKSKREAWDKAKARYDSSSVFKKVMYAIRRERPKDIENTQVFSDMTRLESMSINGIRSLYGGDHDR